MALKTQEVCGGAMIDLVNELKHRGCFVRAVEHGKLNGHWTVEYYEAEKAHVVQSDLFHPADAGGV